VLLIMGAFQITLNAPFNIIVGSLMVISAVGLLRKLRWGRRMSVAFMWLLLFFAIGDILPARAEIDESLGRPPATTFELVMELLVLCSVALASLHFLGKEKTRFRSGRW